MANERMPERLVKAVQRSKTRRVTENIPTAGPLAVQEKSVTGNEPSLDLEGRVKDIVQQWAELETEPASDDILAVLWARSGLSGDFKDTGAADLSQQLNDNLHSSLRASDMTNSTSVSDLVQMIE